MWSYYSFFGPCVRSLRRLLYDEDLGERQASIELKYVKINWINKDGNQAKGFLELIRAFSDAPTSVYGTDFIKSLATTLFSRFKFKLRMAFGMFVLYALSVTWYLQNYLLPSDHHKEMSRKDEIARWVTGLTSVILFALYVLIELNQLLNEKFEYFNDFWNFMDILSIANNTILIYNHVYEIFYEETPVGDTNLPVLVALCSIFVGMKIFYWFNLFHKTSFYIVLIYETIVGIMWFLLIFFGLLLMLGSALFLVNKANADDQSFFRNTENLSKGLFGAFFN